MAVIMCSGFAEELYSTAQIAGGIDRSTAIFTLKKGDLPLKLHDIAERGVSLQSSGVEGEVLETGRYVIFNGSRGALEGVMKGFRAAYRPGANSVIFAVLTDTAKTWTLQYYLDELSREHAEMLNYRTRGQTTSVMQREGKAGKTPSKLIPLR